MPKTVAQIPWGHNRIIISKIKDKASLIFFVEQCLKTLGIVTINLDFHLSDFIR